MSKPGYIPGDPWVICDVSGKQIRMSQSRKTWDGLRVAPEYWDPKHPQLSIRAVPDHMEVYDARPRGVSTFLPSYGFGQFTLISPNGTDWTFWCDEDGALLAANLHLGEAVHYLDVEPWRLTVDDDGALHVGFIVIPTLLMVSPLGVFYNLQVDDDGAAKMIKWVDPPGAVTHFTLISPGGLYWEFDCDEDGALLPVAAPPTLLAQSNLDIGRWRLTVDDDGAVHTSSIAPANLTGSRLMASPNGVFYKLVIVGDGAIVMTQL